MAIRSIVALVALSTSSTAFRPAFRPRPAVTGATCLNAVSRRNALVAASVTAAASVLPSVATAADPFTTDPAKFAFNGIFKDPKHPEGYRVITGAVNKQGTMILQDDPKGQVFNIPIKAEADNKGKITLTIDFSVKGGPKDVVATVNKKDSSISFPDGNLWKKEQGGVEGVYIDGFAPYPKYRRVIRKEKDSLVVDMISGKRSFKVVATSGPGDVTIDFPGGKTCKAIVDKKKGTISFADGNKWTKV